MRLLCAVLASTCVSASAFAQSACRSSWTVQASRDQQTLNLKITEAGTGPACDLVVKGFDYLEGAAILSATVSAAKFCPLDAIAHRHAVLSWQLPQELRSKGSLKLIVNGSEVGILSVDLAQVGFKGGCQ